MSATTANRKESDHRKTRNTMTTEHEALAAVESINSDLGFGNPQIQALIDRHGPLLSFQSSGYECSIEFGPFGLWDSQDDPRPWDEAEEKPAISIEGFVRQKLNAIFEALSLIDL